MDILKRFQNPLIAKALSKIIFWLGFPYGVHRVTYQILLSHRH